MPNIVLTYRCNLKCYYCFANEFVNKNNIDMSEDNFLESVQFLTKDGSSHIGLIGGEPTLHPKFENFLNHIIINRNVHQCTIYTNGILLDKFIRQIVTPKFRLLVNCNSPNIIGEINFQSLINNLDLLIKDYYMRDRINLGINLFDEEMDYNYIIELLERYNLHRVRISLIVPDFSGCNSIEAKSYFREYKPFILKFFKDMDKHKILPYYDCNIPPQCIWTEEEKKWIDQFVSKYNVTESNLVGSKSFCYPVIDVLPDLSVIRCFGLSHIEKVKMHDFKSLTDIASYFLNSLDAPSYQLSVDSECQTCYERKIRRCTAGCIGFKQKQICNLHQYVSSL